MKKRFLVGLMVISMIMSGSMSAMAAESPIVTEAVSGENSIDQTETEDETKQEPEESQETDETGEADKDQNETEKGEDEIDETDSGTEKNEDETDGTDTEETEKGEDETDGTDTEETEKGEDETDGADTEETENGEDGTDEADTEAGEDDEIAEEEETEAEPETMDAEDALAVESQGPVETEYVLNPIYASEYTTEDLITYIAEKEAANDDETYRVAVYDASSIADAANLVKNTMKVRGTDCTIQTSTSNSYKDIFQAALIDNLSTAPNEGDYLRANWYGYRVRYYTTGDTAVYMYTIEYVDNAEQEAAVTNRIPSVLNSMNLSGKTEFEKIKTMAQ